MREHVLLLPESAFAPLIAMGALHAVGDRWMLDGAGEVLKCPAMEIPEKPMRVDYGMKPAPRNRAERRSEARSARRSRNRNPTSTENRNEKQDENDHPLPYSGILR
jgi:hypothetical protein